MTPMPRPRKARGTRARGAKVRGPGVMAASQRRGPLTLFSGPRDPDSHRVRLVLAEKGVECEIIEVQPPDLPEDLIDLNPYQSLPTLADRELVAYDSRVIVEYLDERYPHPPLMPADPVGRAQTRVVLHRFEQDWYPAAAELDAATRRPDKTRLRRVLRERILAAAPLFGSWRWLLSDDFTLVDCTVGPVLWRLPYWGIKLPRGASAIAAYAEALFARPGFQRSLTAAEAAMRP